MSRLQRTADLELVHHARVSPSDLLTNGDASSSSFGVFSLRSRKTESRSQR